MSFWCHFVECCLPEAVLFSALSDVAVKNDGEDDDENDGDGGATGNAGPFQQDLFPQSCRSKIIQ